ncbi:MAG: BlaI/MecI/CopY family transcriptional regulator [bacterium]
MRELTKAEEQLMQIVWRLKKGFVNDIIRELPEPKPAYNTVSTIIRILEKKGFVSHKAYGKTYEYFPIVSKRTYTKSFMKGLVNNYFGSSFHQLVSFLTKENKISLEELEEIKSLMEYEITKKRE